MLSYMYVLAEVPTVKHLSVILVSCYTHFAGGFFFSYDVTSGLPETILEYLLETRVDEEDEQETSPKGILSLSWTILH